MKDKALQTNGTVFIEQIHMCKICGELFSIDEMLLHQNIHIKDPHICVQCGMQFMTRARLKIHMKCHSISKQYKSEVCAKECLSEEMLTHHKISHSEDCPFECDICMCKFKRSYQVTKKIHEGDKKYVCDICGYGTVSKSNIEVHLRRHLGKFHFKCELCGKGFYTNFEFQGHINVHTGEKPHQCDVCSKALLHKSHMIAHQQTSYPDEPEHFYCDKCSKGFPTHQVVPPSTP